WHSLSRINSRVATRRWRVAGTRGGTRMSTPTFVDILRAEVARMQALQPARLGEFARAHAAIVEGQVVDTHDGNGKVLSRNGHTWYTTNGVCTCAAADHGKACRHLQAWKLYQHVAKKHAEATAPALVGTVPTPPAAPLPEAPCSVNVEVVIAGRQVQVTLRATDEAEVLTRLEAVLARYPLPQAAAAPQGQE